MAREEIPRTSNRLGTAAFCLVFGAGFAILAAGTMTLVAPSTAQATPAFASQTKLPCTRCHTKATGGALTKFGAKFQANGNQVK
jgi:hypothetical protein